jgi:NAD(P)-dependent dehydrogenase (short-subunit alcohol dehydrogenase family)
MGRLEGKVALITGASSGIGRASARCFVEEGARVVLADIQDEPGRKLAAELGERAAYIHADVASEPDVRGMIELAVQRHGRLDCLFNNAGFGGEGSEIHELDTGELFQRTVDVLFKGVVLGMKHAAPVLREQRAGCILTTASVAGVTAGYGGHIYTAMKAAVINLTRAVAVELGPFGVRVNAICPGGIATPIFFGGSEALEAGQEDGALQQLRGFLGRAQPIPRAGEPLDIAQMAAFLASDEAAFVSGQAIVVDGALLAGSGSRAMASLAAEGAATFEEAGVETPGAPAAAARRDDA